MKEEIEPDKILFGIHSPAPVHASSPIRVFSKPSNSQSIFTCDKEGS